MCVHRASQGQDSVFSMDLKCKCGGELVPVLINLPLTIYKCAQCGAKVRRNEESLPDNTVNSRAVRRLHGIRNDRTYGLNSSAQWSLAFASR